MAGIKRLMDDFIKKNAVASKIECTMNGDIRLFRNNQEFKVLNIAENISKDDLDGILRKNSEKNVSTAIVFLEDTPTLKSPYGKKYFENGYELMSQKLSEAEHFLHETIGYENPMYYFNPNTQKIKEYRFHEHVKIPHSLISKWIKARDPLGTKTDNHSKPKNNQKISPYEKRMIASYIRTSVIFEGLEYRLPYLSEEQAKEIMFGVEDPQLKPNEDELDDFYNCFRVLQARRIFKKVKPENRFNRTMDEPEIEWYIKNRGISFNLVKTESGIIYAKLKYDTKLQKTEVNNCLF